MRTLSIQVKRTVAVAGVIAFSTAVYQADSLRKKYKYSIKLNPPTGPNSGFEKWAKKLTSVKERLVEEKDDVFEKTSHMIREMKAKFADRREKLAISINDTEGRITGKITKSFREILGKPKKSRRVKLIMLGDSLVCGVGCDNDPGTNASKSSPPLPKLLAKILSFALQADVEWCSYGYIGATVADLRTVLLPEAKSDLLQSMGSSKGSTKSQQNYLSAAVIPEKDMPITSTDDLEIIVVVVCGLNDWKLLVEQFPYGPGPAKYRDEMTSLIQDIEVMGEEMSTRCSVYLPAMPLICGRGDPSYDLGIAPLTYFVDFVSYVWDQQKRSVALDNEVSDLHNAD